jgi:hypothetical protein
MIKLNKSNCIICGKEIENWKCEDCQLVYSYTRITDDGFLSLTSPERADKLIAIYGHIEILVGNPKDPKNILEFKEVFSLIKDPNLKLKVIRGSNNV